MSSEKPRSPAPLAKVWRRVCGVTSLRPCYRAAAVEHAHDTNEVTLAPIGREEKGRLRGLRLSKQKLDRGTADHANLRPTLGIRNRTERPSSWSHSRCKVKPSIRRKPVSRRKRIAARPVGCSPSAYAVRISAPNVSSSTRVRRRSRGTSARRRTPLAGLRSIFFKRTGAFEDRVKGRDFVPRRRRRRESRRPGSPRAALMSCPRQYPPGRPRCRGASARLPDVCRVKA